MEEDVRCQFSIHISALVTLNNSILDKVKDLEAEVDEGKRRHENTKQMLVHSMNKRQELSGDLLKLKEEVKGYRTQGNEKEMKQDQNQRVVDLEKEVEKYKARVQVLQDNSKAKEREWAKAIKGYKEFKSSCTCQDTSIVPEEPSLLGFREDATSNKASAKASAPCTRSTPNNSPAVLSNKASNCTRSKPSNQSRNSTAAPSNQPKKCSSPAPTSSFNPSKRLRRASPVGTQRVRYSTPPKPNLTVYADDSQDSPEIEKLLKQPPLEQSFANAPTIKLRKSDHPPPPALSPSHNEECHSPVILQEDWSELEMFGTDTPVVTKQPRKFNILTEFKGDVSISEEKLGFSLDSTCPPDELELTDFKKKVCSKSKIEKQQDVSSTKAGVRVSTTTHTTTAPTTSKDFKFEAVVRNKEDRLKMKGSDCPLCVRYYEACGLPPDEIKRLIGDVTRHRHMHDKGGDTPPGYWDMTLPDGMATQPATQKKPRKKNKYLRKGL